jgi:hypothetical protein
MTSSEPELPKSVTSTILGQLALKVIEFDDDESPVEFYECQGTVPPHGKVVVIVYPPENSAADEHSISTYADSQFEKLLHGERDILPAAANKIRSLFLEYWPDRPDVTPDDLIVDLRLHYVKLLNIGGSHDIELIYKPPRTSDFFPSLDLCLSLNTVLSVTRVWFDG